MSKKLKESSVNSETETIVADGQSATEDVPRAKNRADKKEKVVSDGANNDFNYVIKNRKARRAVKHKKVVIIVAIILVAFLIAGGIAYSAYTAVELNSFKIFIDSGGSRVLSLSANKDFSAPAEHLSIAGPSNMDNTSFASGKTLSGMVAIEDRFLEIITTEGFQGAPTDKFIAATFFLRNVSSETQKYNEVLNIRSATNNVDKAMRVMLVRNYDITVYAKRNDPSVAEEVVTGVSENNPNARLFTYTPITIYEKEDKSVAFRHEGTEPWLTEDFYSESMVFYNQGVEMAPGETVKYTIIIWLEGYDHDCKDDILFGVMQLDLAFEQAN